MAGGCIIQHNSHRNLPAKAKSAIMVWHITTAIRGTKSKKIGQRSSRGRTERCLRGQGSTCHLQFMD